MAEKTVDRVSRAFESLRAINGEMMAEATRAANSADGSNSLELLVPQFEYLIHSLQASAKFAYTALTMKRDKLSHELKLTELRIREAELELKKASV